MAGLVEGGENSNSKWVFLISDHSQSEQSRKLQETAFFGCILTLYKDVSVLVHKTSTEKPTQQSVRFYLKIKKVSFLQIDLPFPQEVLKTLVLDKEQLIFSIIKSFCLEQLQPAMPLDRSHTVLTSGFQTNEPLETGIYYRTIYPAGKLEL